MLQRAIHSVLNQSLKNLEHIIIDDCSTDDTEQVVKNIQASDERVIYIKNQTNSGPEINRMNGLRQARGKYIVFIDDDDYYTDMDFFSKAVKIFEDNPDKDLAFVAANEYSQDLNTGETNIDKLGVTGYISGIDCILNPNKKHLKPASTFYSVRSAEKLKQAGLCEKVIFDATSPLYAALYGNAYFLPDVVGVYVAHKNSITLGYSHAQRYYKKRIFNCIAWLKQYKEIRDILYTKTDKKSADKWYTSEAANIVGYSSVSQPGFAINLKLAWIILKESDFMPALFPKIIKVFIKSQLRRITPLKKLYKMLKRMLKGNKDA